MDSYRRKPSGFLVFLTLVGSSFVFAGSRSVVGMALLLPQDSTAFLQGDKDNQGHLYEVFYHHLIKNPTTEKLNKVLVYLTVPPDDDGQRVESFQVESFGNDVEVSDIIDEYGNNLKRVVIPHIDPGKEVEIGFSCEVRLWEVGEFELAPNNVGSLKDIPAEIVDRYTRDHRILGLDSEIIKKEAKRLTSKHPNLVNRVLAIHDLVAERIKYHRDGPWDAAPVVLERGKGSCSEFSYVFCALCRASGIPTRFVGSSSLCKKAKLPYRDEVWHRWVEAYLPGLGWVPFDVTRDRGQPAKRTYAGKRPPNLMVVTRKGDSCKPLGLSYLSSNSHSKLVKRKRFFIWSQGAYENYLKAKELAEEGKRMAAIQALKALIEDSPGTRGAVEAEKLIKKLGE